MGHVDWTLIVQIATFFAFLWLLYRLTNRTLSRLLRQRSERIESALRTAEENQRRAAEMQREIQQQLDQARVEAESINASAIKAAEAQRETLTAQARSDADALVERARTAIQRERQAAVDELRREAGRLAILGATHVVGSALDPSANRRLADQAIAEVGDVGTAQPGARGQ